MKQKEDRCPKSENGRKTKVRYSLPWLTANADGYLSVVRDAEVAEERVRQLKDKEKPKPKGPIKYPIDDLDVVVTDRERKLGKQVMRPPLERELPFGVAFEPFLMSWAFLQAFG